MDRQKRERLASEIGLIDDLLESRGWGWFHREILKPHMDQLNANLLELDFSDSKQVAQAAAAQAALKELQAVVQKVSDVRDTLQNELELLDDPDALR